MARNSRKGTFSGRSGIEIWGLDEIVRKLDRVNVNINSALQAALVISSEPVKDDMRAFMQKHMAGQPVPTFRGEPTQKTEPRGTGQTQSTMYTKTQWSNRGNVLRLEVGYNKSKGGLPALFLDVGTKTAAGTPLIKPTFFVYYAINNHLNEIHRIQVDTLNDIFREFVG